MNPFPRTLPLLRRALRPLACAAALAAAAPGAAHAVEVGLNVNGGAAPHPDSYTTLADTGAKWARHFLFYDDATEAVLSQGYDGIVATEQAAGVKTMLTVAGKTMRSPSNPQAYADYVGRLARRYAGRVDAYEIWNEPDERHFWSDGPDARRYTDLLQRSYAAIKAADPKAMVVLGPTTGNNYQWIESLYRAGAKGYFDAAAVHTDTACLIDPPSKYYKENGRIARYVFLGYREVRATMLAHGDDKPIIASEVGWSATRNVCDRGMWAGQKAGGVSEADQARFMTEAFHCLAQEPYIKAAMWFNNRDRNDSGSELDSYGLKRFDGSLRPAYHAFKQAARSPNGDPGGGDCGDFGAPTVQILSPRPGAKFYDQLVIKAMSPDKDVLRMSFYADGNKIRNYTNSGSPLHFGRSVPTLDWQRSRRLAFGPHTIRVTAVDRQGNEGSAEVPITRVDAASMPPTPVFFEPQRTRLKGKGRRWTFTGKLDSELGFRIGGKAKVVWQSVRTVRRKGRSAVRRWKKVHGGLRSAKKTFRFKQRLKHGGRWRARVEYVPVKPYKRAFTCWVTFSTTGRVLHQTCPEGAQKLLVATTSRKRGRTSRKTRSSSRS